MNLKANINLRAVRELEKTDGPAKIRDSALAGFQVWKQKNSITYYIVKKVKGKAKFVKLGNYPGTQPEEARRKALDICAAISNHGDIAAPSPRLDPTLEDAVRHYTDEKGSRQYKEDTWSIIRSHCRHLLGRKIKDITEADFQDVHDSLHDTPVVANHCISRMATAIDLMAKDMRIDLPNHARKIKRYVEKPRERFLNASEAPKLIAQLERMAVRGKYKVTANAILMMVYTGQRKSNVLAMRRCEIFNGIWTIPAEKFKTRAEKSFSLNEYALKILDRMDGKDYVFPAINRTATKPHVLDVRKTFATACRAANVPDCHIHDLRRTLGSWMIMSGIPIAEVSRALGHSSIAITERVYAHILPSRISKDTGTAIANMLGGSGDGKGKDE